MAKQGAFDSWVSCLAGRGRSESFRHSHHSGGLEREKGMAILVFFRRQLSCCEAGGRLAASGATACGGGVRTAACKQNSLGWG